MNRIFERGVVTSEYCCRKSNNLMITSSQLMPHDLNSKFNLKDFSLSSDFSTIHFKIGKLHQIYSTDKFIDWYSPLLKDVHKFSRFFTDFLLANQLEDKLSGPGWVNVTSLLYSSRNSSTSSFKINVINNHSLRARHQLHYKMKKVCPVIIDLIPVIYSSSNYWWNVGIFQNFVC